MKASLFGAPLYADALTCGSAVGATRLAGAVWRAEAREYKPDGALGAFLTKRYEIYRKLYDAWTSATRGADVSEIFGGD
jgi:sugar (pentulose or hexulose) kinase